MLIVFCVERPSEKGTPMGGGIEELCGSSSCVGGLRSLLNTEGILTLPMLQLHITTLTTPFQQNYLLSTLSHL